jgi:hypothetical protein
MTKGKYLMMTLHTVPHRPALKLFITLVVVTSFFFDKNELFNILFSSVEKKITILIDG